MADQEEEGGDDPVFWVDIGDSDDEEETTGDKLAAAAVNIPRVGSSASQQTSSKTLDDPLLGRLDQSSKAFKGLAEAQRKHDPAFNIRDERFDPTKYLAGVHSRTSLDKISKGIQRLRGMTEEGGKVSRDSKVLIRNNFGRFVAAQDKMAELQEQLLEVDGPSLGELETVLNTVSEESHAVFSPMLNMQERTGAIRNVLTVLDRHQAIFQLPSQIREDGASGEYEKVVSAYHRAKTQLSGVTRGVMKQVMEEVESQVDILRRSLKRRLGDPEASVSELSKAIIYISKLSQPNDDLSTTPLRTTSAFKSTKNTDPRQSVTRDCMKIQKEVILQMMRRSVANFNEQVAQLETDEMIDASYGVQGSATMSTNGSVKAHLAKMDSMDEGNINRITAGYEGLAMALVSSLTSVVVSHSQRLIALEDSSTSGKPKQGVTRSRSQYLDSVLGEIVGTFGQALNPVFVKGCDVNGIQIRMSHLGTLSALDQISASRNELANIWDCPPELLSRVDEVIMDLCSATLEEIFTHIKHKLTEKVCAHKRLERGCWHRDIEDGTTDLPHTFRELLLQGLQRVRGLVAPSNRLREIAMRLCVEAMEGLLDMFHHLAFGTKEEEDAFLTHWTHLHRPPAPNLENISSDRRAMLPDTGSVPTQKDLYYPLSGAGPKNIGREPNGEERVQMLLMVLADCVFTRKNVDYLLQECSGALSLQSEGEEEPENSVVGIEGEDIVRLCTSLENILQDKYVRGCTFALSNVIREGISMWDFSYADSQRDKDEPDAIREYADEVLYILTSAQDQIRCLGSDVQDQVIERLVDSVWRIVCDCIRHMKNAYLGDEYAVKAALQIDAEMQFFRSVLHRYDMSDEVSKSEIAMKVLKVWLKELGVSEARAEIARKAAVREAGFRARLYIECFE